MSALDDLRNKNFNTQLELCVLYWGDPVSASDENIEQAEFAADELAALNARVEELERVRKIASEIFAVVSTGRVVKTAQACKHGNYATAPYNHAWWCDECFWELEAALKGQTK